MFKTAITISLITLSTVAGAQDFTAYDFDGSFDDATFGVENAIIDHGLVIDYISHVGEMLSRTQTDVGSDVTLYDNAQIFVFCYGVFVADTDGAVTVGYRHYPDGAMQEVQALLDEIAREAVGE